MQSPILAIADQVTSFHVVCDASDFAIGCALMQFDTDGAERVSCYQLRQLQAAERNYPVNDKELLAMKYALDKFRVYLLGVHRLYGPCVTTHGGKQSTPLAKNGEVAVLFRVVQLLR